MRVLVFESQGACPSVLKTATVRFPAGCAPSSSSPLHRYLLQVCDGEGAGLEGVDRTGTTAADEARVRRGGRNRETAASGLAANPRAKGAAPDPSAEQASVRQSADPLADQPAGRSGAQSAKRADDPSAAEQAAAERASEAGRRLGAPRRRARRRTQARAQARRGGRVRGPAAGHVRVHAVGQTVTATALPTIVGDLGGVDHMQWVTTAYVLASTIMMPDLRQAGRPVGPQVPVHRGAGGASSCGSATVRARRPAWTAWWRGAPWPGSGGGGLIILAQATIADMIPPRQRGKYMGVMGVVLSRCPRWWGRCWAAGSWR